MKLLNRIWRKTECPSATFVLFNRILIMKQAGKFSIADLIPKYLKYVSKIEGRKYYYWLHYSIVDGR